MGGTADAPTITGKTNAVDVVMGSAINGAYGSGPVRAPPLPPGPCKRAPPAYCQPGPPNPPPSPLPGSPAART
jgi:hypothetical protein